LTSSFSKPIIVALDTGHKIVYYVFFPQQKYASHVVHTNGPYVSSMCVLCNVGSLALHIIMYTYLPEKTNMVRKKKPWRLFQSCNTYDA